MPTKKVMGTTIALSCGANVFTNDTTHTWKRKKVVTFHVTDPNQCFNWDWEGQPAHKIELAINRQAIPAVIRILTKAFKESA